MSINSNRVTVSRLKTILVALKEAWTRIQTELGVLSQPEAEHDFKVRLGIVMNNPYNSEIDAWKATLVAQTMEYLAQLSSMWKLEEYGAVRFQDEGWVLYPQAPKSIEAIVLGVESKYAIYVLQTTIACDADGKTLATLVSTLLPQATFKAIQFCEHFIKEIETAPF